MSKILSGKKKWLVIGGGVLAIILIVALLLVNARPIAAASIQTATATRGDINSTVVSSGTLAYGNTTKINIPTALEIEETYVEKGEFVNAGDALAKANYASLLDSIEDVRAELKSLDSDINSASNSDTTEYVKTYVAGRVKLIYAEKDASASDIMQKNGALIVLSIDGKMAVDLETSAAVAVGDKVTVVRSDKTEKEGKVESIEDGVVKVTLTDNGPMVGESVSAKTAEGKSLGSGALYINQPIGILGSGGTVSSVQVSENQYVYSGSTVVVLKDVPASAAYEQLVAEREEVAQALTMLVIASGNGGTLLAPFSGTIESVGDSSSNSNTDSSSPYSGYGLSGNGEKQAEVVALTEGVDPPADTEITDISAVSLLQPVVGSVPVTQLNLAEYQISVVWSPAAVAFMPETTYSASYTLTAKTGYLFAATLVPVVKSATVVGAAVSPDGKTLTFTAVYEKTASISSGDGAYGGGDLSGYGSGSNDLDSYSAGSSGSYSGGSTTTESALLTAAFEIATDDSIVLSINVDELDINDVQKGQVASVTLDAVTGVFEGTVTRISSASSNTSSAKFKVDIALDKTDAMRVGMNATAVINIDTAENVITIPIAALQEFGGRIFVYTQINEDGETLSGEVDVETGVSDGTNVEIVSGLSEGDTVYYIMNVSNDMFSMFGGGPRNYEENVSEAGGPTVVYNGG